MGILDGLNYTPPSSASDAPSGTPALSKALASPLEKVTAPVVPSLPVPKTTGPLSGLNYKAPELDETGTPTKVPDGLKAGDTFSTGGNTYTVTPPPPPTMSEIADSLSEWAQTNQPPRLSVTAPGISRSTQAIPSKSTPSTAGFVKGLVTGLIGLPSTLKDQELNPTDVNEITLEKSMDSETGAPSSNPFERAGQIVQGGENNVAKVFTRFFTPMLTPLADDISKSILSTYSSARQNYGISLDTAKTLPGVNLSDINPLDPKTWGNEAKVIGDVAQVMLAAFTPPGAAEGIADAAGQGTLAAFKKGLTSGAAIGFQFGTAQVLSQQMTDPKQISQTILLNTMGVALIGALSHSAIPAGSELYTKLTKDIIKEYDMPRVSTLTPEGVKGMVEALSKRYKRGVATPEDIANGNPEGKIEPHELKLMAQLMDLTNGEKTGAMKGNMRITISTDKIVTVMDKPWFQKFKGMVGIGPSDPTVSGGGVSGINIEVPDVPETPEAQKLLAEGNHAVDTHEAASFEQSIKDAADAVKGRAEAAPSEEEPPAQIDPEAIKQALLGAPHEAGNPEEEPASTLEPQDAAEAVLEKNDAIRLAAAQAAQKAGLAPTTDRGTQARKDLESGKRFKKSKPDAALSSETAPGQAETFQGYKDVTTKILDTLKGKTTVSKQYIADLTKQSDIKGPEKDIITKLIEGEGDKVNVKDFADKVKAELLPLQRTDAGSRYESISLPAETRGPIANYSEHVYQSPIKTSVGDIHFSAHRLDQDAMDFQPQIPGEEDYGPDHYFGHTRVEDLPGKKVAPTSPEFDNATFVNGGGSDFYNKGTTRRVIEVQSDLYQKGRLENEVNNFNMSKDQLEYAVDSKNSTADVLARRKLSPEAEKRAQEVAKLQQYSNPTAHFRMVREEIKQAAKDGKTKIQFPTGETAMKIEGLGTHNEGTDFRLARNVDGDAAPGRILADDGLKVGQHIFQGPTTNSPQWIITDVLGDGKFKAMPKDWSSNRNMLPSDIQKVRNFLAGDGDLSSLTKDAQHMIDSIAETFDISGRVDTNNPIYKFYEKDLGKYLTNKYNAKTITDTQGVTWNEVDVPKSAATEPVPAFKRAHSNDLKNQGTHVYYGGYKYDPERIGSDGISLTTDPDIAKYFEGRARLYQTQFSPEEIKGKEARTTEFYIDPKAKILSFKDIPDKFKTKEGLIFKKTFLNKNLEDGGTNNYDPVVNYARELGYDGVDLSGFNLETKGFYGNKAQEKEIRVFNPDVLKTKEDLMESAPFKRGTEDGTLITKEDALKMIRTLIGAQTDVLFKGILTDGKGGVLEGMYQPGRLNQFGGPIRPLITLVTKGGMVESATALHEAVHAYLDLMIAPEEKQALLDAVKKNIATLPTRAISYLEGYKGSADERAEEYIANEFPKFVADQKGYEGPMKTWWQKILDTIRSWIRKTSGLQDLFDRMSKGEDVKPDDIKRTMEDSEPKYKRSTEDPIKKITDGEARDMYAADPDSFYDTTEKYPRFDSVEDARTFIGESDETMFNSKALGDTPFSVNALTDEHLFAKARNPEDFMRRARLLAAGIEIAENAPELHGMDIKEGITYYEILGTDKKNFPNKIIKSTISEKSGKVFLSVRDMPMKQAQISTLGKTPSPKGASIDASPKGEAPQQGAFSDVQGSKSELTKSVPSTVENVNDEKVHNLLTQRDILLEAIKGNPARQAAKFANKNGDLPQVLGGSKTSKFGKSGDEIAADLGYPDSESLRRAYSQYRVDQARLDMMNGMLSDMKKTLSASKLDARDEASLRYFLNRQAAKLGEDIAQQETEQRLRELEGGVGKVQIGGKTEARLGGIPLSAYSDKTPADRLETYENIITEANGGVKPPVGRGGVTPPPIDWTRVNDKAAFLLSRETMERNLEKVAGPQADAINHFLVDQVRLNETAKTKFVNAQRLEIRQQMKEWNIRKGKKDSKLVQLLGEKQIDINQVRSMSRNWANIAKAADYFRSKYDMLLDLINHERVSYGYPEIPKRTDYLRHFTELNQFAGEFGVLFSPSELPTAISGITDTFKPGKPFTTVELRRLGKKTKLDAIAGFDNYLDSAARQMFHIDSVQRGRVLEQYIRDAARATEGNPDKSARVRLPNFVANLHEYTNLVSGKASIVDRSVESLVGRNVMKFMNALKSRFGKNVIGYNLSSAVTHAIPTTFNIATVDKISAAQGLYTTLASTFSKDPYKIQGVESKFLVRRYPVGRIQSNFLEKAIDMGGFVFNLVDHFISHLAVASNFHEGIRKGLSPQDAMDRADNYANRIVGDRSIGSLPNLMNTKTLGWLTQFQIEINDNMSVLLHDIPRWSRTGRSNYKSKLKIASILIQFAVYSYLFNHFMKNLKGSGKGLDPIELGLELAGMTDDSKGLSPKDRAVLAGGNLWGELPFSTTFSGQYPVTQGLPNIAGILAGTADPGKEGLKFLTNFASPIGGGAQLSKTIQGVSDVNAGEIDDSKGNKTADVAQTPENYARAAVFGPSGLPEKQDANSAYIQNKNATAADTAATKAAKARIQPTYDKVQALVKEGKTDEASALVDGLSDADYAIYKKIASAAKTKATDAAETAMMPTVAHVQDLVSQGKTDDANAIVDALTDDDYKIYQLAAKRFAAHPNAAAVTPAFKNGTKTSSGSIISSIVTYAEAIGADPVTAFNRIFTGQHIKQVKNGTILVDRMSLAASEADRAKDATAQGLAGPTGMNLDHVVPLEAGGDNSEGNLQLIPEAQWKANTPIEDFLASELTAGNITGAEARELAIRFKAGNGETLTPALMKEYKDKYGSQPLTADEVRDYQNNLSK